MLQLIPVEKSAYRALYAAMKRDFPPDELPPCFAVRRNLRKGVYTALFLEEDGQEIGYIVMTAPDDSTNALISFLAVSPERRSKGYGGELLRLLRLRFAGRVLALEAEAPAAAASEEERLLRERRIRFYKRAGFRAAPTARANIFGVPMEIMVSTQEDVGSVRELMRGLYQTALPSERWLRFIDVEDV